MRLIVTEKDSAARKIAEILGGKVTVKEHGRGRQKVRSYHFAYKDDDAVAIGLRGHVMETVFPNTYRRWSLKYLGDMIETPDLAWVVDGGAAGTLAALRTAAKGATEVVIATDYDREGELIGHEALEILRGDALKRHPHDKPEKKKKAGAAGRGKAAAAPPAEPPADNGDPHVKAMLPAAVVDRHIRVRYSALTREEVEAAFAKPSTVDFNLAEAAHSRQDIDLIWGAVLTRFMSLASYRYGSDYLSVGRVQSPTLRLIVDRELERRAFVPVPYWEIKATLDARRRHRRGGARQGPLRLARGHGDRARARPGRHRRGHRLQGGAAQGRAAGAVQHDGAHERRLGRRRVAGARHARRRVAVPRRPHQLPAHRQHGVPAVARPARQPRGAGRAGSPSPPPPRAWPSRASSRRRAARSAPPTTRPSTRSACPRRSSAATRPRSTTSSCAAFSRRCCRPR